jgi:phosphatidate cytidylyltransferase
VTVPDGAIALRALHYWLLFPAAALAAHLIARATGHEGFLGRVLVWLAIIPAVLFPSYLGPAALTVVLAASCVVACWEIVRLGNGAANPWPSFALAATVSLPWLLLVGPPLPSPHLVVRLLAVAAALWYPLMPPGVRSRWGPASLALGTGASLSFWLLLRRMPGGFGWVLFAFSVVVINDMISFLAGKLLGGRRPLPVLSPRKTLSGYVCGAAAAVLAGYALSFAVPDLSPGAVGAGALLLVVFGSLGDLFLSAVKRRQGAKDSGTCLGPMGGMLDRLDSLLGAGWVFVIFVLLAKG